MTAPLTVAKAADAGLDDAGGKWVVICEKHSTVVNVRTKRDALTITEADFCEGYADTDEGGGDATPTG